MPRKGTPKKRPTKEISQALDAAVEEAAPKQPKPVPPAPPEEDFEDADSYEPYAPKPGAVPLAAGETQETAVQPGDWSDIPKATPPTESKPAAEIQPAGQPATQPEISEQIGEHALESPETALESSEALFGAVTADDLSKWLTLAVDAINWLAKRDRRLKPKDKGILKARIENLQRIRSQIP